LTSDFTPPTGAGNGPGEHGPWNNRLLSATSKDGLTWTRTGAVVTDQGDVPDLVIDKQGWVYLYYTGWTVGNQNNKTVVAISQDLGKSWVYKYITITGADGGSDKVDPDVQILDDGTFRLYATWDPSDGKGARTHYFESKDGLSFTFGGQAYYQSGSKGMLDPTTIKIGSTWHLFAGGQSNTPSGNFHATSTDGKTFTTAEDIMFASGSQMMAVSNGLAVDGGYRMYCFNHGDPAAIYSFFTTDGVTWTEEAGKRLEVDSSTGKESGSVKDASVVRLPDGSYLMVYVSQIPK
jgi:hypothetical protein